jgi:hypothetical protein
MPHPGTRAPTACPRAPSTPGVSVVPGTLAPMTTPWTLLDVDAALRASWAADTCSPDDLDRAPWHPGNPAWGHCDITALVVHDIFGGLLVQGEVHDIHGEQQGFHWWNRLPGGAELDVTREQFRDGQAVSEVRAITRPVGPLPHRWAEYLLLRERVSARLGPLPGGPEGEGAVADGAGGVSGEHPGGEAYTGAERAGDI